MEQLFAELVGKPRLNPPKIITIIAENFSLLEDQARFLKATLAIPTVKELPIGKADLRLVQIGPSHCEIEKQFKNGCHSFYEYRDINDNVCEKLFNDLSQIRTRSIIFINDVSKLQLLSTDKKDYLKLIELADRLKRTRGHFMVLLFQSSLSNSDSTILRDIEFMSDAVVKVKSFKSNYSMSIWWESVPKVKTLISPRIDAAYYICKIGKFYYNPNLLCFHDVKSVPKNFDLESTSELNNENEDSDEDDYKKNKPSELSNMIRSVDIVDPTEDERDSTLPYTQAQNPEQSRIFYYPDKEDDIDEEDPDNDLLL